MGNTQRLLAVVVAMNLASTSSFGADGKIADWGLFKFGMTVDQVKNISPEVKAAVQDPNDNEISAAQVPGIKLGTVEGAVTVRFYKDRAFEFAFLSLNAVNSVVPSGAQSSMSQEDKIAAYCPTVFEVALDLLSASYGRADEILRPSDLLRLDKTQAKSYRGSWWLSDGSRVRVASTHNAGFCSEFVSMRSARYAKVYVPEVVTSANK